MSETYNSSSSILSGSNSDEETGPCLQTLCSLCSVKLNIIGIHHTKSTTCTKCRKIICNKCLSKQKLSNRICKICEDKELLVSDMLETQALSSLVLMLKGNIVKAGIEKQWVIDQRNKAKKKIEEYKQGPDENTRAKERELLEAETDRLKFLSAQKRELIKEENNKIKVKNTELIEVLQNLEGIKKVNDCREVEFSSMKRSISVYNMDTSILTEKVKQNTYISAKESLQREILQLTSSLSIQNEKNQILDSHIKSLSQEFETLSSLKFKLDSLLASSILHSDSLSMTIDTPSKINIEALHSSRCSVCVLL